MSRPLVSSSVASGAASSGECSRSVSCASRRAWSRSTVSTSVPSSAARRRARSSGSAVRNTFTAASGATTVPMSRPSATQSPTDISSRCLATSASRTAGLVATREAASDTSGVRMASVTSRPSATTRSPSSRSMAAAASEAAPPSSEQLQPHGAVHRARVEVGEAQRLRRRARHRALAGPGGPVDSYDHERVRVPARAGSYRRPHDGLDPSKLSPPALKSCTSVATLRPLESWATVTPGAS